MSFIPRDPNSSQTQKIRIERQPTESSSNNESFKSTPKGSPDLSNFTPKDNNNGIKIKSFVPASGSEDFLTYSDDSENNLQKRVKVSTPLQIMKKSQQDFPEKRHKHHSHHNKQNDNSNKLKSPKSKTSPKNNVQNRDINLNNKQSGNENDNRNPFAEFDDQSPQMLSSSSVQTGEEKQNEEHEVWMKPRNRSGMKKPKLVDVETQVKYHIVQKDKTPDHKTETVQTRNVDQFEIDFDDDTDDRRNSNSRKEDKINAVKQRGIDLKDIDKRKSPKHADTNDKNYFKENDEKKSPRHHHHRKSPRHQYEYENDDYDRRKSPRHHHSHDRRISPRYRDEYDRDYDRHRSPRYRDEYESEDYDRHRSPRHRYEYDRDYDRQRSSRYSRDYDDNEYDRRKSPRHRYEYESEEYDRTKSSCIHDDREYDRHRSSRYSREYEDDEYSKESVNQSQPFSNNQQDFSSSNSIDRLADSIQPNTMTIRNVPLDEIEPPESPTKATQTIENDVFERDFNLPENEVDECGEGLRFLSTIFNSSSSAIVPNDDAVPFSTYQQRVDGSIEKARALQELASQKPPKLADISIQNDMTDDEMQEELLSSSFDKRLQEVDFEYDNDLVKERNVDLKFIQQKQELSEDSDNNGHNESFNFMLSENDEDENKNQGPTQKVPSKVRLSTENIDMSKYSSKASFRSKSGDLTIAPNFTEDSYSSIHQPPESEKNLMPLSEELQAIEASVDQTKTKETLSAAMSSIDLYTEIEEEEEDNDQDQNTYSNKYSFGEKVKERGFGQIKLNNQSDSSKKSQRSEANLNSLTNENSFSEMSDIPKSPITQQSMLSNEKLLSQSPNSNESHSIVSNKSNQSYQSTKSNQSNQSSKSNQSHQSNQSSKSNQSKQSNQSHHSTKSNQSQQKENSIQSKQSEKSNKSQELENSIQSKQSEKSNKSQQKENSIQSKQSEKSNKSQELENSIQSKQSEKSNKSQELENSIQSKQSTKSHQSTKSNQSNHTNKSNQSNHSNNKKQTGDAQKSAFSLIYSEQETDEMNKQANRRSPFTYKNRSLTSSGLIDPNSAPISSAKQNINSPSPTKNRNISLNNDNNRSGFSSQSFSHSPPINDDVFEEEEDADSIVSEKSANIFLKNKDIKLTPSEESSLIHDFPGDSISKEEKPKSDFPIKSSSPKQKPPSRESSKIDKNDKFLESNSLSNIEFVKNRNINMRQSEESSLINDFPGDSYKLNDTEKKNKKTNKQTNDKNNQLNFPRVSSESKNKINNKADQSPKDKLKSPKDKPRSPKDKPKTPKDKPKSPKKKEDSIRSEIIIQLQASDYSENSKPIFNLGGDNSENISKKLKSLKIQNSSSLSSSLYKNAQNQQRKEASDTQSYESNGSNKKKNKTFQPITLNQLSTESDSFNNNKNENKVLQLNDLDDNSSISDNFNNNSTKRRANTNYINRSNQQKNYFNDNDEKASSSNEEKE